MLSPQEVCGLPAQDAERFVAQVLAEDLGLGGDVTTELTISPTAVLRAIIQTREEIVLAGVGLAEQFFLAIDAGAQITRIGDDGDRLDAGAPILEVEGNARALLSAERSALNTLQHLTGIATATRAYRDKIAHTPCILLDTRKTIPGLRAIEKYAARMGGAQNHRMRLDDGILIKDNHVATRGGDIAAAVRAAKSGGSSLAVQVEVDAIEQIEPALAAGADRLLCDNMTAQQLKEAVAVVAGRVPIEASGGVRLDTIQAIAESGVDFVSVGRITQSAPAADIGLDYRPA